MSTTDAIIEEENIDDKGEIKKIFRLLPLKIKVIIRVPVKFHISSYNTKYKLNV